MMWAGTACRTITPAAPAHLAGYAARWDKTPSTWVHDELYAKALYLKNEETTLLLMSVDLCELPQAQKLQHRIAQRCGVQYVLIAATHTHSGPYTVRTQSQPDAFDATWYAWACDQMEEAAVEAVASPFPARLGATQTDVTEVGKNRRTGATISDPALTVLCIWDQENAVRTLWLNYACHCTILDGNSFAISADYPGYLYQQLGAHYPQALVLFTNGAAGDINIGYSSDASALGETMAFRSFETAERMAAILSERTSGLISGLTPWESPPLRVLPFTARLPLKPNRPSPDDLLRQIEEIQETIDSARTPDEKRAAAIRKIYLQSLLDTLALAGEGSICEAPSLVIQLGHLMLITTPTELFCEVGLALKQHIAAPLLSAVVGYAGGYVGYLPTAQAMQVGGYEAEVSPFDVDAADHFVRAAAQALQSFN